MPRRKQYGRLTELNSGLVRLRNNVRDVGPNYEKVVDAIMMLAAAQGQDRMRLRAPWRDNTGNRDDRVPGAARAGLHTVPMLKGRHKSILFSHGVDYGIWLEVKHNGKDQIIMPTVAFMGRELMKSLRGSLNTVRSS